MKNEDVISILLNYKFVNPNNLKVSVNIFAVGCEPLV